MKYIIIIFSFLFVADVNADLNSDIAESGAKNYRRMVEDPREREMREQSLRMMRLQEEQMRQELERRKRIRLQNDLPRNQIIEQQAGSHTKGGNINLHEELVKLDDLLHKDLITASEFKVLRDRLMNAYHNQ